jgi:hypothetical protein
VLEHFVHSLIQILDVLVGVIGERIACGTPPDQLLGLGIEQIDNQHPYLIGMVSREKWQAVSEMPVCSIPLYK